MSQQSQISLDVSTTLTEIIALLNVDCTDIAHIHAYGSTKRKLDEIVKAIRCDENLTCIEINCLLAENTPKTFIEELSHDDNHKTAKLKADSMDSLTSSIEKWCENNKFGQLVFLMTHAEALAKFKDSNWLAAFFGICKNTPSNLVRCKMVTMARVPWSKIGLMEMVSQPIQFALKNYTKEDLIKEITTELEFPENFIRIVVDSGYIHCRDFYELIFMVKRITNKFIDSGGDLSNIQASDVKKFGLFRDELFYRLGNPLANFQNTVELPYLTKFVLIAAYCASYNPINTDGRFFTKARDKNRRRTVTNRAMIGEKFHETGPKPFELRRLFFIYLFFLKSYAENLDKLPTVDINDQVSRLCTLALVSRVSAPANLDLPKFRCDASLEFANEVARSVGITDENGQSRLRDYLFDFANL